MGIFDKINKRVLGNLALIDIIFLTVITLVLISFFSDIRKKFFEPKEIADELKIIEELRSIEQIEPFTYGNYTIEMIGKEDLKTLALQYPTIYSGIDTDVYKIEFRKRGEGLLVIYDFQKRDVVRMFNLYDFTPSGISKTNSN